MAEPNLLRIATCQFSIEAEIEQNLKAILSQIASAAEQGADVAHFPETALSGYAGVDIPDSRAIDWEQLRAATADVCAAARRHQIAAVLGSTHYLDDDRLPHNCLYVIDRAGEVVERYDKRFCTGTREGELDLAHYTPGSHTCVFELDGYRCGALICYDYRFPELYRDLKRRGVEVLFQSFHNARRSRESHETYNVWRDIVPATMMCRAASNHFWISANNSTARYSSWPSFFVRPDGLITGRLEEHEPGVLLSTVDRREDFWDASAPWRDRALAGVLHSGSPGEHPRTRDRSRY